jgi:hypothetical protein
MLAQNHLNLRLIRLKGPVEWINNQDGLSLLFAKRAGGKCLCGLRNERVVPGLDHLGQLRRVAGLAQESPIRGTTEQGNSPAAAEI